MTSNCVITKVLPFSVSLLKDLKHETDLSDLVVTSHSGRKVLILDELEDIECLEGDTAMFRCRICPSDFIEVKWYLDETQLYTNDLNEIQVNPGGYHSLAIKRLARKDSGTISFVAGDKRSYASLLVRGNDRNTWWRIKM